jgi:hypothetical protein
VRAGEVEGREERAREGRGGEGREGRDIKSGVQRHLCQKKFCNVKKIPNDSSMDWEIAILIKGIQIRSIFDEERDNVEIATGTCTMQWYLPILQNRTTAQHSTGEREGGREGERKGTV